MKKKSSRSRQSRNTKPTPVQMREWVQTLYDQRQAHWHQGILKRGSPDWGTLLGLHLQMAELERLMAGIEEIG